MEYRIVPMPWRNKNNAFSQNRIIIMMSMMMVSSESRMISIIFSRSFIRVENLPYIDMMCCYNVMDTRHCNIIPICNNYNNHCSSESHYAHSETFAEKSENYKINNIKLLLKYTRMLPAAERLIILTSDEQYRLSLTIKSDAWRIYIIVMGKSNCNYFCTVYDRLRLTCANIISYKIMINIICTVKLYFERRR